MELTHAADSSSAIYSPELKIAALCVMEETNPDLARYMRKVIEDEEGGN